MDLPSWRHSGVPLPGQDKCMLAQGDVDVALDGWGLSEFFLGLFVDLVLSFVLAAGPLVLRRLVAHALGARGPTDAEKDGPPGPRLQPPRFVAIGRVTVPAAFADLKPQDDPSWPPWAPKVLIEFIDAVDGSKMPLTWHWVWVEQSGVRRRSGPSRELTVIFEVPHYALVYDRLGPTIPASFERGQPGLDLAQGSELDETGGVATSKFDDFIAEEQKSRGIILKQERLWRERQDHESKKRGRGAAAAGSDEGKGRQPTKPAPKEKARAMAKANRGRSVEFLARMARRGLAGGQRRREACAGALFVAKKSGDIRAVVDARQAIQRHRPPPGATLASGEALGAVDLLDAVSASPEGRADLDGGFDPPRVAAGELGISTIYDEVATALCMGDGNMASLSSDALNERRSALAAELGHRALRWHELERARPGLAALGLDLEEQHQQDQDQEWNEEQPVEEELADLATPVPACGTATPEAAGAQASEEEGGCGPAACPADEEGTPEAEQAELAKEDPAQPDEAGRAAASPVRPAGTGGTVRKDSIVMLPKGSRKDSILLLPTAARRHSLRGLYATMVLPPGLERGHAGEGLPCPTSGAVALGRRLRSRDASNSDTEGCTGQGGAPPGRLLPLPAPVRTWSLHGSVRSTLPARWAQKLPRLCEHASEQSGLAATPPRLRHR
ncbi:unnamed protein product, partial [Prorocentrum cordatum]